MDQFDRAQKLEQQQRDYALNAARRKPKEKPYIIDGKRVCVDCMNDIDERRLKHVPDAARCIRCQQDLERRGG